MDTQKIKVLQGPDLRSQDKKTPTVIGSITVEALSKKGKIPYYKEGRKGGYQRNPNLQRVNDIAQKILNKSIDLPTAILISIKEDPSKVLRQKGEELVLDISSSAKKFNIVDGQHRFLALQKLVDEVNDFPASYKIPFVAMLGADDQTEMFQFYLVNSTARPVRTDLALRLLGRIVVSDKGGQMHNALIATGKDWKVKGMGLLDEMLKIHVWKERVRMPNAEKGNTTVPSTSMVLSFESLLKTSGLFSGLEPSKQAQLLDAYWHGIEKIIPEAFIRPGEYSLQKGIGVRAMHGIFLDVFERARGQGKASFYSPDAYAEILQEPLTELSGESSESGIVQGSEFWRSGRKGAVGNYTSGAGVRILIDKIRQFLPPIDISGI